MIKRNHLWIELPYIMKHSPYNQLVLKLMQTENVSSPCMNSKSLLTTVFKNLQWSLKKRGYWPTTYMMLEAMMALLSFPLFCSHNPSKSWNNQIALKRIKMSNIGVWTMADKWRGHNLLHSDQRTRSLTQWVLTMKKWEKKIMTWDLRHNVSNTQY